MNPMNATAVFAALTLLGTGGLMLLRRRWRVSFRFLKRQRRDHASSILVCCVAWVLVALLTPSVDAAGVGWGGAPGTGSGDWSVDDYWQNFAQPTPSDVAQIANGGTIYITQGGATCLELWISLPVPGDNGGTVEMSDGTLTAGSREIVGYEHEGTFNQSGGINTISESDPFQNMLILGYEWWASFWDLSKGTYNLSGTGQLSAPNEIVGFFTTGEFNQSGGVNRVSGSDIGLVLGAGSMQSAGYPPSNGTYNLSGDGTLEASKETIGDEGGRGTFTQTGGTNTCDTLLLAKYPGATGAYNLSGSAEVSLEASMETIGDGGTGTFTQTGGVNTCSTLRLAWGPGSVGTYNLDRGTLILSGTLEEGEGTATFNFGGGYIQTNSTFTSTVPITLTGVNGSSTIDTSNQDLDLPGYTITLSSNLSGNGGLTKIGDGTLILSGTNTYTGGTTINGGVLQFASPDALPDTPAAGITINSDRLVNLVDSYGTLQASGAYDTVMGWLGRISPSSTGTIALSADSSEDINMAGYNTLSLGAVGTVGYTGTLSPAGNTYRLGGGGGTLILSNDNAIRDWLSPRGLVVSGPGTVELRGANTYTGGTTVLGIRDETEPGRAVILAISAANNLGPNTNRLTLLENAYLAYTGEGMTLASPINDQGNNFNGGFRVDNPNATLVVTSDISGANVDPGDSDLGKFGPGTLELTGNIEVPGYLYLSNGIVRVRTEDQTCTFGRVLISSGLLDIGENCGFTVTNDGFSEEPGEGEDANTLLCRTRGRINVLDNASFTVDGITTNAGWIRLDTTGEVSLGEVRGTGNMLVGGTNATNAVAGTVALPNVTVQSGSNLTIFALAGDSFTKGGAGTLELSLSGGNDRLSPTGALTIADGVLDLAGDRHTTSGVITFQGGLVQNGTIVNTGADYRGMSGTVSANLDGSVGLTKTTGGTLVLTGTNTYTGGTTINGGVLQFANTGALPTTPATRGITVNSGGALEASGPYDTVMNWLDSNTISTSSTGALALSADSSDDIDMAGYDTLSLGATGTVMYTGTLTPAGNTYYLGGGGGTLTYTDAIAGNNNLVVGGPGIVVLSADNNSYTGGTTINGGALRFAGAGAIPTDGNITINIGGALEANVSDPYSTVTAWLGSGKIATGSTGAIALSANSSEDINMAGYNTLSLGATGTAVYTGTLTPAGDTYYLGGGGGTVTLPNDFALTGPKNLVVGNGGGGTVVLSGTNTYTGSTTINAGTLLVNGTNTDGGQYTVADGATLGGTGSVEANLTVNTGATLAPGASVGTLTVIGNTSIKGILSYEIYGDTSDLLTGAQTLTLGPTSVLNIVASGDAFDGATSYTLADYQTLLGRFGTINNLPSRYMIHYCPGSIILAPVPEPSSMVLLGMGVGAILARARRWRK